MNIFSDFHHSGLYTSLQLLFEKRLGYRLYRPIGEDWFKEGYWLLSKPYNDVPETITQYLGIRDEVYQPIDGTRPLNEIKSKDSYYMIKGEPFDHKAVTLEQFKEMDIDIVIASYAPHIRVYTELIKKYKPKAKLIHQQGNEWYVDFGQVKNLLASVLPYNVLSDINACWYHEEFATKIYNFTDVIPKQTRNITSFVNTLATQSLFHKDWIDFIELEKLLPEFTFRSYGASTRDGIINSNDEIANIMKLSAFGFHEKTGGDGFGMVIHQWGACGRPVIFRSSQYDGRLAGRLLSHLDTGIDLDKVSIKDAAKIIKELDNTDEYWRMCGRMYKRFTENIDFDKEEIKIRDFLSKLK